MSHENEKQNQFKIRKTVKEFAKVTFKKFKEKEEDEMSYNDYLDKDDLRRKYKDYLLDRLPDTIDFLVRYGHLNQQPDVQETKERIYQKFNTEEFAKMVKKSIKRDDEIENIELLPIAIRGCLEEILRYNQTLISKDPNTKLLDTTVLTELSEYLLKDKIEKLVKKAGCTKALAFDLLSLIPCKKAIVISRNFRLRSMFECMYQHKKSGETINVKEIIPRLIKEDQIPVVVIFALLERKEKFGKLSDEQKSLYLDITNWCFDMLESFNNEPLKNALEYYAKTRKKDDMQGKDSNRRYSLDTLMEEEYPKTAKMIKKISSNNPDLAKYFK